MTKEVFIFNIQKDIILAVSYVARVPTSLLPISARCTNTRMLFENDVSVMMTLTWLILRL